MLVDGHDSICLFFQEDNDDLYLEPEGWFDHFQLAMVLMRSEQWEEN